MEMTLWAKEEGTDPVVFVLRAEAPTWSIFCQQQELSFASLGHKDLEEKIIVPRNQCLQSIFHHLMIEFSSKSSSSVVKKVKFGGRP
ncbi:hypothetical protein DITRI_Ditri11bG0132200 [Diplodiscus trichospermus]